MKKTEKKHLSVTGLGIFCTTLLVAFFAVYLYSPTFGSHADTLDVNMNVGATISLSLDKSTLLFTGLPGEFTSGNITATVMTNSGFGYTLTLEDQDSDNALRSEDSNYTFTSDFLGNVTSSTFADNTWGYSVDATNFYSMPIKNHPVAIKRVNTTLANGTDSAAVTFGAKIGGLTTSGAYKDHVVFAAYSNGVDGEPEGISGSSRPPIDPGAFDPGYFTGTMQNFDCSTVSLGEYGTLTDVRNNKQYSVAKLGDGRCWMTRNLDIDNITLTPDTSDITSNYTIPAAGSFNGQSEDPFVYDDGVYGKKYNYLVASAGTVPVRRTETTTSITTETICPKGWTLPDGEWIRAMINYDYTGNEAFEINSEGILQFNKQPFNIVYGDYWGRNNGAAYWSGGTLYASLTTNTLYSGANYTIASGLDRRYGAYVRCVARD